jgi:voltage-gated potassium channel
MTNSNSKLHAQFLRNGLTLCGALLAYYFFPLTRQERPIWQLLLFVSGLALMIWLVVRQLIKQLTTGSDPGVKVRSLITLLYPAVALFALTYLVIQNNNPTEFEGMVTRTDSLYYTVVTLGTVGYGDIHAVGQLARTITMIQIAFDLVVVGALVAVASSRVQTLLGHRE